MPDDNEKKLNRRNFDEVAAQILAEYRNRKSRRVEIEKAWDDIDRQHQMRAEAFNLDAAGRTKQGKAWQPFYELPWQTLAREIGVDDCVRLLFPTNGKYFESHANAKQNEFSEVQQVFNEEMFIGELEPQKTTVNSAFVSKLIDGLLTFGQNQYKYTTEWLKVLSDAITYGTYAARYKIVEREKYEGEARNVSQKIDRFPAIIHYPIRNVYLDDSLPSVLHTDNETGPSHIFVTNIRMNSLLKLLKTGSDDGWVKGALAKFKDADPSDTVELIEMEGDFIVPRAQEPIFLPSVSITVAQSHGAQTIVRYQQLSNHRTWLTGTYFPSGMVSDGRILPYGTSPLMMGRTIQAGGTCAFNRTLHAAILNAEPPIGYDRNESMFAVSGPVIEPGASIPTDAKPQIYEIGNVSALAATYQALKSDYADTTGMSAMRLGEQAKSHVPAASNDQALSRAATRTVEFVRRFQNSTLQTALSLEYKGWQEILSSMKSPIEIYNDDLKCFLPITRKMLPDDVFFEVYGVAMPQEEAEERMQKLQLLDFVAKLEPMINQMGGTPLNWGLIRDNLLRDTYGVDAAQYIQQPGQAPSGIPNATPNAAGIPNASQGINPQTTPTASPMVPNNRQP